MSIGYSHIEEARQTSEAMYRVYIAECSRRNIPPLSLEGRMLQMEMLKGCKPPNTLEEGFRSAVTPSR